MPVSEDDVGTIMPEDSDATIPEYDEADLLRDIRDARENLAACPGGHPDRGHLAAELGEILRTAYEKIGDIALSDEGIKVAREALALRPPTHPERADSCRNLGSSLYARYEQCGDLGLLDEAIELGREAFNLQPPGHPHRALSCANLATALHERYEQCNNLTLLDEAIELERKVLDVQPPSHPQRALSCANLATSLHERYEQSGDLALIDEAMVYDREVLALHPSGYPERADSCNNLAASLHVRYEQCGEPALLEEAIELEREALALRPLDHPMRALSCNNLATSLHRRYGQCGDVTLLDEAIKFQREALALLPPRHSTRALSCSNLANSLHTHYRQCGDVNLLDEAIELKREALALQPPGHPERSYSCAHLGMSLAERYRQWGNITLLDEAIELQREALTLRPPGHPEQALSCANLGSSLRMRYEQCGDLALLDEAIELKRDALALRPSSHPDRAISCNSLGSSLHARYRQCGNLTLLDEAIELQRDALALRPPGHPDRAVSYNNLATSLHARYTQCGDVILLDEAIELKHKALALWPPGHPHRSHACRSLSVLLIDCYKRTKEAALLDNVIKLCDYALQSDTSLEASRLFAVLSELHLIPDTSHFSIVKALHYLDVSFGSEVSSIRDFINNTSHSLSRIWSLSSIIWTSETRLLLCGVYAQIIDRLPLAAGFVLDTPSRLQALKSAHHIGTDACVVAALADQPSKAVESLDRAHGLIWTQALHQRDPQMEGAPPGLASELASLLRETAAPLTVQHDDPSYASREDSRHRQNTRIQTLLREIRAKPGLERFMLGRTYDTLREAARDHPVVVLAAGRHQAFALIMSNSSNTGPDILRLNVANDTLQSFANIAGTANLRYRAGSTEYRRVEASDQDSEISHAELKDQERAMRTGNFGSDSSPLARLWFDVVKPVLTHLGLPKEEDPSRRPRLHWCTAGRFASITIHAAGIYTGEGQECCSDYVVSSYTPTISTLLRARKDLQPMLTASTKLLLVAAEHTADAGLPVLGKVKIEMQDICSVVEKAGAQYAALSKSVAKTAQATAALPAANLVHIACHGLQHTSEPLKSAFYLSDHDVLSVSDLMKLDLKGAFLAFLSACETAKGDRDQPDQAIHLAATMLFVGFKSVVATMWAMRDEDGPVVAKAFYEKLLEGDAITADAVPYALDYAVRKLRESGAPVGSWATFIHVGA